MKDIKCIMIKELWEIRQSKISLILITISSIIPVFILSIENTNAVIPKEILIYLYPLAMAFAANIQILLYSLINERKQRTLEVLLSLNVKKSSIILGKILPSTAISLTCFFLISLGIKIMIMFKPYVGSYSISIFLMLTAFFVSYLGGNICILTTLLFPDEKAALSSFMLFSLIFMFLIYFVSKTLSINSISFTSITAVLCVILTITNIYIFDRRADLITKI